MPVRQLALIKIINYCFLVTWLWHSTPLIQIQVYRFFIIYLFYIRVHFITIYFKIMANIVTRVLLYCTCILTNAALFFFIKISLAAARQFEVK